MAKDKGINGLRVSHVYLDEWAVLNLDEVRKHQELVNEELFFTPAYIELGSSKTINIRKEKVREKVWRVVHSTFKLSIRNLWRRITPWKGTS